jgi:hypothetical protein
MEPVENISKENKKQIDSGKILQSVETEQKKWRDDSEERLIAVDR